MGVAPLGGTWVPGQASAVTPAAQETPPAPLPAQRAAPVLGARRPGPPLLTHQGTWPPARQGPQPQRWDIDAAQPGRATATMSHGCGCRSNDGPSLRLPARLEQHLWDIDAVTTGGPSPATTMGHRVRFSWMRRVPDGLASTGGTSGWFLRPQGAPGGRDQCAMPRMP